MEKEAFMLDNISKEVIFIIKRVRYIYVFDFKNSVSCWEGSSIPFSCTNNISFVLYKTALLTP